MRARVARAGIAGALLLLAGCASADPVSSLGPAPADADPTSPVATLTTLLTEVYAHGLDASATPTTIVSDGATVDVAVTELTQALDLGEGARDFAAATAFEVGLADDGAVTEVQVVTADPQVVGSRDGMAVATVGVVLSTSRSSGPTTEMSVTYAVVLDGDRLADVEPWAPGIDSGVGLGSPTGAVQRFLDLVHGGDLEAARFFSDGTNTDTQLRVLAQATDGRTTLTEVPQAQLGSAHVVYALDPDGRVLGRFEVLLSSPATVIYQPTA
ncbi:hypothetical protein [Pseudactinotalea sp.]|uniref:hypothetical protein n=1 Tax=Pseudactinotalea sp. TaxID=1926260 RepID=UPI003B3A971E